MVVLCFLTDDPLNSFSDPLIQKLGFLLQNSFINLDNHSDPWLLKKIQEQLQKDDSANIIIIRRGMSEFGNLLSLIRQLYQLSAVKIIYSGVSHQLIEKLRNFRHFEVVEISDEKELLEKVVEWKE